MVTKVMQLNSDQQKAFNTIEATTDNIFVCGKPGVGKSVLIRELISSGKKHYTLAAPTGLAALNIGGKTLHSLFQIPISEGIIASDYDNYTTNQRVLNHLRFRVNHLIIDECSMVRADIFDYIDRVLRHAKGNDYPFGGVQIILVGDLYQLQPVAKALDIKQLKVDDYDSPFIFSARAFTTFKKVELNEVMRQKGDPEFLDILDAARIGKPTFAQLARLNQQIGPHKDTIRLVSTNREADLINGKELAKLDTEEIMYQAKVYGDWPVFPLAEKLTLKPGAQVMVKVNGADSNEPTASGQLVNGSLGKVIEVHKDHVVIECNGNLYTIYKKVLSLKVKTRDESGQWSEQIVASFEQIPLQLAWAISIHKSQGQTFDSCHIDAKHIFVAGQLYVALTRCRTLDGITLAGPLLKSYFKTNEVVNRFFKSYK